MRYRFAKKFKAGDRVRVTPDARRRYEHWVMPAGGAVLSLERTASGVYRVLVSWSDNLSWFDSGDLALDGLQNAVDDALEAT